MERLEAGRYLSGKVQTVLGEIEPEDLGTTITHEHLLIDLIADDMGWLSDEAARNGSTGPSSGKVGLTNLGRIRFGGLYNRDNFILDDEQAAIDEAALYRKAGGRTIVDATCKGIGRNPAALARIAKATGLNVIMGSSYYVEEHHRPEYELDERTEDEIAREIVCDIVEGVDNSGVRAGLIGEVGCSWPITANERKVLRASGKAQRLTGAPLMVHPGRHASAPAEIVDILREVGADITRTIICHIDRTIADKAVLRQLADTGCILEYDLFGYEHSYYPWTIPVDMPNDGERLRWISWLVSEGYGSQIVMSHDICMKYLLVRYGGAGYAHILENVVPYMRRKNFSRADIEAILIDTPRRLFTFVPPNGSPGGIAAGASSGVMAAR